MKEQQQGDDAKKDAKESESESESKEGDNEKLDKSNADYIPKTVLDAEAAKTLEKGKEAVGWMKRWRRFNEALIDVIEEYGLVQLEPLDINNKEAVLRVLMTCDR